jgi:hypothetical protein
MLYIFMYVGYTTEHGCSGTIARSIFSQSVSYLHQMLPSKPYIQGVSKKTNLGISQEIDIVLKTKDFRRLGI